jgi:hypothetical protein
VRPEAPLFEGGRPEAPLLGKHAPTLGKRTPMRLPEFPQKGDVGKRFPRSTPVPGAWETWGACTPPWGTRPRGTLLEAIGEAIIWLQWSIVRRSKAIMNSLIIILLVNSKFMVCTSIIMAECVFVFSQTESRTFKPSLQPLPTYSLSAAWVDLWILSWAVCPHPFACPPWLVRMPSLACATIRYHVVSMNGNMWLMGRSCHIPSTPFWCT